MKNRRKPSNHKMSQKVEQAEAEVVPSSSLVEVEVGVEDGVEVEVGVWVKMQFSFLPFSGGWVVGVGWLEKSDIKLISTQDVVVVEVELGINSIIIQ